MGYNIGRLGQLYVAEEATYGVPATLLASHALRHLDCSFAYNPKNRVKSDEKKLNPGRYAMFDRATTAALDLRSLYLRPAGTIATLPEAHLLLKHSLGTHVLGTLTTTVASASSSTQFTVQAGQGANVTVGEWVSVRRAANNNIPEARLVVAKSTDTLTVAPALGGTPVAADTVKAGVTYKLASDIAKSLTFWHYLTDVTRVLKGAVCSNLTVSFDRNEEVRLAIAGGAMEQTRPAPGNPGFTTIGAQNPPSGLTGGMILNGAAYKFLNFELNLDNALELINENYGTSKAEGYFRSGFREVTFSFEARVTEDLAVYTLCENVNSFPLFMQTGQTEGNIVAFYAPAAQLEGVPDFGDDIGALTYSFQGSMIESAFNAQDEISIGLL